MMAAAHIAGLRSQKSSSVPLYVKRSLPYKYGLGSKASASGYSSHKFGGKVNRPKDLSSSWGNGKSCPSNRGRRGDKQ